MCSASRLGAPRPLPLLRPRRPLGTRRKPPAPQERVPPAKSRAGRAEGQGGGAAVVYLRPRGRVTWARWNVRLVPAPIQPRGLAPPPLKPRPVRALSRTGTWALAPARGWGAPGESAEARAPAQSRNSWPRPAGLRGRFLFRSHRCPRRASARCCRAGGRLGAAWDELGRFASLSFQGSFRAPRGGRSAALKPA